MSQENLGQMPSDQLPQSKKKGGKARKIILWVFSILVVLALAIAGGLYGWYTTGKLAKNSDSPTVYRSSDIEKQISDEIKDKEDDEFDYGTDISSTDIFKDVTVKMEVTDNQAKVMVSYKFDREAMADLYDTLVKEELAGYSEDIRTEAMKTIPSNNEFMENVDAEMAKTARQSGLEYDAETGVISGELFEGTVHPLTRTIEVSSYNESLADEDNGLDISKGDSLSYKKSGDKVTFVDQDDEENSIIFTRD